MHLFRSSAAWVISTVDRLTLFLTTYICTHSSSQTRPRVEIMLPAEKVVSMFYWQGYPTAFRHMLMPPTLCGPFLDCSTSKYVSASLRFYCLRYKAKVQQLERIRAFGSLEFKSHLGANTIPLKTEKFNQETAKATKLPDFHVNCATCSM